MAQQVAFFGEGRMNVSALSKAISLAGLGMAFLAAPAFSHHSFAMFDVSQTLVVEGVVTEYELTNPHSWLRIEAMDIESGQMREWAFEASSPAVQALYGMGRNSVHAGDGITVTYHPMRDGARGGQFVEAVLDDGTEFIRANREAATEN
jgi:hypothetical protein